MCKRIVLLITLMFLVNTVWAQEDILPAPWVGCDNSGWVQWWTGPSGTDPVDEPEDYSYEPASLADPPVFGFRYYVDAFQWQGDYEGRSGVMLLDGPEEESLVMPLPERPEGEDPYFVHLTEYVQYVFQSETGTTEMGLEIWDVDPEDPYNKDPETIGFYGGGLEFPDPIEVVELEGDWVLHTYQEEFDADEYPDLEIATHCHIIQGMDSDTDIYFDEVIVDFIWHLEGERPDAPCKGRGVEQVSDPSPFNGEEHVPCDVNTLCFYPPDNSLIMDPCADPNLKGPFDFYVYFSDVENEVRDACDSAFLGAFEDVDTNDQICVDTGITTLPGVTYYWAVDINDQNVPGDPCFYQGPIFSFVKWGFAYLISPENEEEDVDPGTIQLLWENDGYGATQNVYVLDDQDNVVDSDTGLGADANSFSPTGLAISQTYEWYVEEVNVQGTIESEHWFFSTAPCRTIDNFEDYTSTNDLGTHWEDYDTLGGDNAVQNALVDTGQGAAEELRFDGNQSMKVNLSRLFIDPAGTADDYTSNSTDFSNLDLTSEGASSVAIAYRSSETDPPIPDAPYNENMYMTFVSNAGNAMIDYTGDVTDPCWAVFYVALDEIADQGGDPCDLDEVRLGVYGDTVEDSQINVYFDLLQRCGPLCPLEEEGAVTAPAYTQLSNDLNGDCWVDADDLAIITNNWLAEDVNIVGVAPDDANLVVEYLFNSDLSDSSGNNNDGTAVGSGGVVSGGVLSIANSDDPCEVNGVSVPNVPTLFAGAGQPVTVAFDVNVSQTCVVFGVARTPLGGEEDPIAEDPCIGYSQTHSLALFADIFEEDEGELVADRFWIGAAGGLIEPGVPASVAIVYEGEGEDGFTTIYVNGLEAGGFDSDPNVPYAETDTCLIGGTKNFIFPGLDMEMGNFNGEIDNFRIYDTVLSQEEVVYLTPSQVYQEDLDDMDPSPNLAETGQFPENIINFLDHAVLAPDWQKKSFF